MKGNEERKGEYGLQTHHRLPQNSRNLISRAPRHRRARACFISSLFLISHSLVNVRWWMIFNDLRNIQRHLQYWQLKSPSHTSNISYE